MKTYYDAKDIKEKTGFKESKVYSILVDLNKSLELEYPNVMRLNAKIPVWYWEEKTGKPERKLQDEKLI